MSAAIEIEWASSTPIGTEITTPISCTTQGGSPGDGFAARCSSKPYASITTSPTTTAWPIVTYTGAAAAGTLLSAPNATDTPSASRTRGQPSARATPLRLCLSVPTDIAQL